MEFYYVLATGSGVESVHVLGDEGEVRDQRFELRERAVSGVVELQRFGGRFFATPQQPPSP